MTNQSTIDKLIEMRLTALADAFRIQMDDPAMKEVPFEDRFGMLVDVEYSNRKNNRLKRLILLDGQRRVLQKALLQPVHLLLLGGGAVVGEQQLHHVLHQPDAGQQHDHGGQAEQGCLLYTSSPSSPAPSRPRPPPAARSCPPSWVRRPSSWPST